MAGANWPPARSRATRLDGPGRLARALVLCAAGSLLAGCGGAHAPCPTPTSEVDRHREESLAAERNVRAALSEDRSLRAKREAAAARVAAAEAALDSMKAAGGAE